MAVTIFDNGLDLLGGGDWVTGTFKALLLKSGYSIDRSDVFVADLTPGSNEISVASYSRPTLAGKSRNVDNGSQLTEYIASSVSFGAAAAGQTAIALVLFKFVTNDADSLLVAHFDLPPTATNGSAFTVGWTGGVVLTTQQG